MISSIRFSKPIVNNLLLKRFLALSNRDSLPFFCKNFPMKLNYEIKCPEVRLVYPKTSEIPAAVVSIEEALKKAERFNLDLILWNENTKPPVCKIASYKEVAKQKYKKQQIKEEREKKMKAIKDVRMGGRIEEHDIINQIKDFLKHQNPVRVIVIGKLTVSRRDYRNYRQYLELLKLPKSNHLEKVIENLKISSKLEDVKIDRIKAGVEEVTDKNKELFHRMEEELADYGKFQGQAVISDLTMTGIIVPKSMKSEDAEKIVKDAAKDDFEKMMEELEDVEITEEKVAKVGVVEPPPPPSKAEKKKSKKPKHRKRDDDDFTIPTAVDAE